MEREEGPHHTYEEESESEGEESEHDGVFSWRYYGNEEEKFHSSFVDRLAHYPLFEFLSTTGYKYYREWKDSSLMIKYFADYFFERNLPGVPEGLRLRFRPLLERLDEFGCAQLDLWEDTGAVQIPYTLLETFLDITEGTIDYWMPAENTYTFKMEHKDEDTLLIEHDLRALVEEGKFLEAAIARFRYIKNRVQYLASSAKLRARERMATFPYALPVSDFIGSRLLVVLNMAQQFFTTPTEFFQIFNEARNNVLDYFAVVGYQTLVLMHVTVDPIVNLVSNQFGYVPNRLVETSDWMAERFIPENLRISARRLIFLFRRFIITGHLNWSKVKKAVIAVPESEYEYVTEDIPEYEQPIPAKGKEVKGKKKKSVYWQPIPAKKEEVEERKAPKYGLPIRTKREEVETRKMAKYEQPKPAKWEEVEAVKIPKKVEGKGSDQDIFRQEFWKHVEEAQASGHLFTPKEEKPIVSEDQPYVEQVPTSPEPLEELELKEEKPIELEEEPELERQQEPVVPQQFLAPQEQQRPDEQLRLKKDIAKQEETKVQKQVRSTEPQRVPRQLGEGDQSPLVSRLQPQQEQIAIGKKRTAVEEPESIFEGWKRVLEEQQQQEDFSFVRSKSADYVERYNEGDVREKVKLWEEYTHSGELPSESVGK